MVPRPVIGCLAPERRDSPSATTGPGWHTDRVSWGETLRDPARAAARRPWRDPVRMGLLVAGAILLVGAPLPWLNATLPFHGDVSTNGFDLPGDGAITFSIGLGLLVLGWFTTGTSSRAPIVVLAPLLLGLATLSLTYTGYRLNEQAVIQIANGGGESSDGIGLAITGFGGILASSIGAIRIVRAGRTVDYRPRIAGRTALRVVAGTAGAIGTVIAIIGAAPETGGAASAGGVTFLVMFGGLFGAYAGVGLVGLGERLLRSKPTDIRSTPPDVWS